MMTTMIINLDTKNFGTLEETSTKGQYIQNHVAEKITKLRYNLHLLKIQFKGASEEK